MRICTLRRSAEFHRVRGGVRWSGPGFLIEGKMRPTSMARDVAPATASTAATPAAPAGRATVRLPSCAGARFGFTVTKKLGGAVDRNRIRRRLRECLRQLDQGVADPNFDYVIVARKPAAERLFVDLGSDFERAFAHLHRRPQTLPRQA